jgi:hypothetical protein
MIFNRFRLFVSTVLLMSAAVTLGLPLLLLATPSLGKSPVVDDIAFVSLVGLFPLMTISSLVAAVVSFVRTRALQAVIEIMIACLLLVVVAMNGTP